jgi:uncharacterized protein YwqG
MTVNEFREKIKRRAIVMDIGGFRPPDNPMASWFGKVNVCLRGEGWPMQDGKPMHALAQINVDDLPFRPLRLSDIGLITIFIGSSDDLPIDEPNGQNWCLRAYQNTDGLVLLDVMNSGSSIKPFPMRPRVVEEDYPCWEDIPYECPEEIEDDYYDLFENIPGFKLGGWPDLIQSEIFWAPLNKHPIIPEYVFQIDTTEKGNWMWGDNGVGYFGRGTAKGHENEWALAWQCY